MRLPEVEEEPIYDPICLGTPPSMVSILGKNVFHVVALDSSGAVI